MSETTTERQTARRTSKSMKWLSAVAAILGLWIAVSPFVLTGTPPAIEFIEAGTWNNLIIGIAIFLIAGYNYYRLMNERTTSMASAALVTLLGLWMIIAPFVFEAALPAMLWSDVIAGALVAILAGYHTYVEREAKRAPAAGT